MTTTKTNAPATPATPTTPLELWSGELSVSNIGPLGGDHRLGTIGPDPGLWELRGKNTAGKSWLLRCLAELLDTRALTRTVSVTHGAVTAELGLGSYRVTFRSSPDGKLKAATHGSPPAGEPRGLPEPIGTLMDPGVKGEDARLRARLKALLSWVPVPPTPERVEQLMRTCLDRSFALGVEDSVLAAWSELARSVNDAGRDSRRQAVRTAPATASDLAEELFPNGGSPLMAQYQDMLAAHGALLDALNGEGLGAEKLAQRQEGLVAAAEETLDRLAAEAGLTLSEVEAARKAQPDVSALRAALLAAEAAAAESRIERRRRVEEEQRREELRATHGERPAELADSAGLEAAVRAVAEAAGMLVGAASAEVDAGAKGDDFPRALATVAGLLEQANVARSRYHEARRTAADAAKAWDDREELLATELPGPTAEKLAAAESELVAARSAVEDAERLVAAVDAFARSTAEAEVLDALQVLASDYREAAKESWAHLGIVLTDALSLPWLRVSGMRIELLFGADGRLFRGDGEAAEVRDLDAVGELSAGELHEACLRLMLDHAGALSAGGVLLLPYGVVTPLDDERTRELAGMIEDAGLQAITERPWRDGEPDGIRLVRVESTGAVEAS